jgi:enediyne biosynthesis protein E4
MRGLLLFGLIACSSPDEKPVGISEGGDDADDSAPEDPSDADDGVSDDTGPSGSDSVDSGDPVIPSTLTITGTSITCENPEARETQGPMSIYVSDGDWSNQRGEQNLWSLYAGQGLAVGDFDSDGIFDVFLPNADADQLFMGSATGEWIDGSDDRLPPETDEAVGATPVDIDDDGDIDIFVAVMNAPNRVLINDGTGHFSLSDSPWLAAQTRLSQGSAWGDVDGDGDLDVFVSQYTNWSPEWLLEVPTAPTEAPHDVFWINQGDGSFENADETLVGFDAASAFTFTAGFWDRDDDADLDLLIINDYRSEYDWTQPIQYFENNAGVFSDAGEAVGLQMPSQGMGLGAAEMNGDGLIDFAIQTNSTLLMYSAEGFRYFESSISSGIIRAPGQEVGWGAELADMNNDGLTDLAVAYGFLPPDEVSMEDLPNPIVTDSVDGVRVEQPNSMYLQTASGQFVDVAAGWSLDDRGVSRGFVLADFNRDGFLDWMGRDMKGPTRLVLSRCDDRSWLSMKLQQPPPNRNAVGAKVTLYAGDEEWVRWVHVGSTNVSSGGPTELHFGLMDLESVDVIEVRWPDGSIGRAEDVQTRQHLLISR